MEVAEASMKVAEASAESGGSFHSRVENVQCLRGSFTSHGRWKLPWTLIVEVFVEVLWKCQRKLPRMLQRICIYLHWLPSTFVDFMVLLQRRPTSINFDQFPQIRVYDYFRGDRGMRPAKFSLLPWNNTALVEASMEVADGRLLESVDWYFRAFHWESFPRGRPQLSSKYVGDSNTSVETPTTCDSSRL